MDTRYRLFILLALGLMSGLAASGYHCDGCSVASLNAAQRAAADAPVTSPSWSRGYRLWGASYDVVGDIGDHVLARCYDAGGYSTGSFIVLFGSSREVNFGERCDVFVDFSIHKGASVVVLGRRLCTHKCCVSDIPLDMVPDEFPTQGQLLLRVDESILLLQSHTVVRGTIVGFRDVDSSYDAARNITPGWDKLQIIQVVAR